jgi:hypothetical protein
MSKLYISEEDMDVELTAGVWKSITVEFRSSDNLRKSNFESENLLDTVVIQFIGSSGDVTSDFMVNKVATDKNGRYKVTMKTTKIFGDADNV